MVARTKLLIAIALLTCCIMYAQKGFEKEIGFDDNPIPIELIELNGVVSSVYEASCDFTYGKSETELHLLVLTDEEQEVHVHLGPVWATSIWTDGVEGQVVNLIVFSIEHLPHNHYVAKELHWDGHNAEFRDEYLKPFWVNGYNQGIW